MAAALTSRPRRNSPTLPAAQVITRPAEARADGAKPNTNLAPREERIRKPSAAALRLFVGQGFGATSLNEIAEAAGLTKGAVLFYFSSKETMLLHPSTSWGGHRRRADPPSRRDERERGGQDRRLFPSLLPGRHRPAGRAAVPDRDLDPVPQPERRDRSAYLRNLRPHPPGGRLHPGGDNARREIDPALPARELASTVIATHDGVMLEWHRRGTAINGRRLVRTMWTALARGIVRPAQPKPRPH